MGRLAKPSRGSVSSKASCFMKRYMAAASTSTLPELAGTNRVSQLLSPVQRDIYMWKQTDPRCLQMFVMHIWRETSKGNLYTHESIDGGSIKVGRRWALPELAGTHIASASFSPLEELWMWQQRPTHLKRDSNKETYNFIDPTYQSHPIAVEADTNGMSLLLRWHVHHFGDGQVTRHQWHQVWGGFD